MNQPPDAVRPFLHLLLCLPVLFVAGCGATTKASQEGEDDDAAVTDSSSESTAATTPSEGDVEAGEPSGKGEDWPKFLGPRGTGVSGETGYADEWPKGGPPVLWKKEIGTGYSAPSIRGNRLIVLHRPPGDEVLVQCLRADDGRTVWTFRYPTDYRDPYGYNNGPRCAPLIAEGRVYTYGAQGKLHCLDLETGELVWARDCAKEFSTAEYDISEHWFFGVACAPILEGDLLITLVGGQPNSGVAAFDKKTGETVWTSVGKQTWDGVETGWPAPKNYRWSGDEHVMSYSSPFAATIHGKRHVLCLMRQGLVSLDPRTGEEHFRYFFRARVHESVNAARPVVMGDKVFLSAAYKVGSALLQVDEDGQGYRELWRDRRNMLNHWSTSIHVDGYLYGFSGRHEQEGEFRCIDVKTGQVQWAVDGSEGWRDKLAQDPGTGRIFDKETRKRAPWPYYGRGSLLQVEDEFVVLGERGTLSLVKIDPQEFHEVSRAGYYEDLSYPVWPSPVLSRGRLYLRDEDTLLCLEMPRKPE